MAHSAKPAILAFVLLLSCGHASLDAVKLQAPSTTPRSDPSSSSEGQAQRITTTRTFTLSDRFRPVSSDTNPALNATQALEAARKAGVTPTTTAGSPIEPSEVLLGLFDHDDGGPLGLLAWGFVFYDRPAPYQGPYSAERAKAPIPIQDQLIVMNANSGEFTIGISGVHRN